MPDAALPDLFAALRKPRREPRPYQARDIAAILRAFDGGAKSVLYTLPTGGGKTLVATRIIEAVLSRGGRVCGLVHRRELLHQASAALRELEIPHRIIAPGRAATRDRMQLASIDTLGSRRDRMKDDLASVDLIWADECHHVVASRWAEVIRAMNRARLFGVTATPYRLDRQGLGDFFQVAIEGPSMRWLIQNVDPATGRPYLVPPVLYAPPIKLDLSKLQARAGDYAKDQLARLMDQPDQIKAAVHWYSTICPGAPTIAFCASVAHARHVAEAFRIAGYRSEAVDGTLSDHVRDAAIRGLGTGRVQVLTSCALIDEGTDVPIVGGALLLSPTLSTGRYLQRVGRVLRSAPGKTETVILDLAACVTVHGLPDEPRKWTLKGGIKGIEKAVAATRTCGKCYAVSAVQPDGGPVACFKCGRKFPIRRRPDAAPPPLQDRAEMEAAATTLFGGSTRDPSSPIWRLLTDAQIRTTAYKPLLKLCKTEDDLRYVARVRGYQAGWARRVMQERAAGQQHYRRSS